jgi:multimeric flavodoxin WrbA
MGGCIGCFNCAASGKCIYKDGFDSFLRDNIQTGNAIIVAFSIKDHSMGARFKMYVDRQFCNGHRTVTEGMPFAYIVNGDYESEHNLKTIVDARAEVGGNYLAGVGYDKETIIATSKKLAYAMENKLVMPRNFYGVGGMKIFRDLIWVMRGIMKADHIYYKKHGVYDFPQKQRSRMILMCLLGSMMRNPKIKAKMGNKFNEGMIAPYKKVLDKMDKKH